MDYNLFETVIIQKHIFKGDIKVQQAVESVCNTLPQRSVTYSAVFSCDQCNSINIHV